MMPHTVLDQALFQPPTQTAALVLFPGSGSIRPLCGLTWE